LGANAHHADNTVLTMSELERTGMVDFALFARLDHERFPEYSLANLEKVAATIPVPTYAIDDQTAIKVTDGTVEVISEGHWKLLTP
jgi:dipeptidase E